MSVSKLNKLKLKYYKVVELTIKGIILSSFKRNKVILGPYNVFPGPSINSRTSRNPRPVPRT